MRRHQRQVRQARAPRFQLLLPMFSPCLVIFRPSKLVTCKGWVGGLCGCVTAGF